MREAPLILPERLVSRLRRKRNAEQIDAAERTNRIGDQSQEAMNGKDIRILLSIMFVGILLVLALVLVPSGCSSPPIHSVDSQANYRYVFGDVSAPAPVVVHSHVERLHRSVFGIIPLRSQYNGDWEFELVVSSNWLAKVKNEFTEIRFSDVPSRRVPEWFVPYPDNFTAWKMQPTSYPVAHLFVEKTPSAKDRIRVFIRRH